MKQNVLALALTLVMFSMSSPTFANTMMQNDALPTHPAQISLAQAISAAEQYAAGTASKAELEQDDDQWVFDVEVINGPKVMDVKVDPQSGKILAAKLDKADHDDHRDRDNEDEHEQKD
ncbi:PepSY domain-containing protein [Desulfobulbus rhabdoformis]|uniref:PepSY domain-containing protein n=1 Tax=Desulfobulbus rhabdoformis TaxID=34032 RepID=UPI0019669233|nr:PepSY domain-containing protein [Desulfobulbus rhabdoformis]MBM9613570.1 PepSY domain-containing protein [Desulfobulbus rhabdoformis]